MICKSILKKMFKGIESVCLKIRVPWSMTIDKKLYLGLKSVSVFRSFNRHSFSKIKTFFHFTAWNTFQVFLIILNIYLYLNENFSSLRNIYCNDQFTMIRCTKKNILIIIFQRLFCQYLLNKLILFIENY